MGKLLYEVIAIY